MSDSNFDNKVLDFVEKSSHALEVASKLVKAAEAERQAVKEKVAALAKKLLAQNLIDEHELKTAEAQLSKTAEALEILDNVLDYYQEFHKEATVKKDTSMGRGVSGANTSEKYAMYAGRRRGSAEGLSNADKALLRLVDGFNND